MKFLSSLSSFIYVMSAYLMLINFYVIPTKTGIGRQARCLEAAHNHALFPTPASVSFQKTVGGFHVFPQEKACAIR
jgi:hypothetical protein